MPLPKIFTGTGVIYPPQSWLTAIEVEPHIRHCSVVVIANLKKDVPALLTDRGVGQGSADRIAKELKLSPRPAVWVPLKMLFDAGLIGEDETGVFAWPDSTSGSPAIRVEAYPVGALTEMGRFRYDPVRGGRGQYIEITEK